MYFVARIINGIIHCMGNACIITSYVQIYTYVDTVCIGSLFYVTNIVCHIPVIFLSAMSRGSWCYVYTINDVAGSDK
jgi:hypothetical protein